jgi:hypothetical protein
MKTSFFYALIGLFLFLPACSSDSKTSVSSDEGTLMTFASGTGGLSSQESGTTGVSSQTAPSSPTGHSSAVESTSIPSGIVTGSVSSSQSELSTPEDPVTSETLAAYFQAQFQLGLSNIYWGEFHSHSSYSSDAADNCNALGPDKAYEYGRDTVKLDFLSQTDHADMQNADLGIGNLWQSINGISKNYNKEDSFIIFPGWEYTNTHGLAPVGGSASGYGHKNVVFRDMAGLPEKRIGAFAKKTAPEPIIVAKTAPELWQNLADYRGKALTIVHTQAMKEAGNIANDHQTDFTTMDKDFVRHLEIYSKWGSSEGYPPEEARCSQTDTLFDYETENQVATNTVRQLLYRQWLVKGDSRFILGFVGGTDNHKGMPANSELKQCMSYDYRGGMTGIASPTKARGPLWDHLYARHTIAATTDAKTPLLMAVETAGTHLLMGDQGAHDGSITIRVLAPDNIEGIDVILDSCPAYTIAGNIVQLKILLESGRHYLYVRAFRHEGDVIQQAWSSPVYLGDVQSSSALNK